MTAWEWVDAMLRLGRTWPSCDECGSMRLWAKRMLIDTSAMRSVT